MKNKCITFSIIVNFQEHLESIISGRKGSHFGDLFKHAVYSKDRAALAIRQAGPITEEYQVSIIYPNNRLIIGMVGNNDHRYMWRKEIYIYIPCLLL